MDTKELKKLWRINNPDKVREQRRRYYDKHKEKMREYYRTYKRKRYTQRAQGIKAWNRRMNVFKFISNGKIECVTCYQRDPRILQIHHADGNGERDVQIYKKIEKYLIGHCGARPNLDKRLELRCANCNILAEYEMGRRFPWLERIDEEGNAIWKELPKNEN